MPGPVVLLHGFTQTAHAWDGVRAALPGADVIAPDLLGHGARSGARDITLAGQLDALRALTPGAEIVVAGYSMGGRIALHWALAEPDRIARLVLVGASPGLADPAERAARRDADAAQADSLEREGLEAWAERWGHQPLFAGQSEAVRRRAAEDRLRNTAEGLAAALRGLGTGMLPSLWDRLDAFPVPVVCAAGERDERFTALGGRMAAAMPRGEAVTVPGAGHAAHLEAPDAVAALLSGR